MGLRFPGGNTHPGSLYSLQNKNVSINLLTQ